MSAFHLWSGYKWFLLNKSQVSTMLCPPPSLHQCLLGGGGPPLPSSPLPSPPACPGEPLPTGSCSDPAQPTSAQDSLCPGFAFAGRKRGPATQLTTACMPPGQAGRSLPRAGATCTWQLAMWGSVPRQLTWWIQKEFFCVRLFSLEDKGD